MIALTFLLGLALGQVSSALVVDPSTEYQTWEGFGTSLAWWANIVGGYEEPLRSELIKKTIGYLKLNILRYNIGGGEAPDLKFMEPRARVPGFLSADGSYDWSADANQRWVLSEGIKLGANKFEAFSNSPPYFMTNSGSVTGAPGGASNLNPAYLGPFSNYLVDVTKHFRDSWGVKFESLDPMNEPCAGWWTHGNRQEGCHVKPGEEQSNLIISVGQALANARLKTRVSASDESYNSWAVSSWDALSGEAKQYVFQINTHCYWGKSQKELNERAVRDGKRLWMSEYGDGDASGMQTAHQIVTDLRDMKPTAWVYWQVIDNGGGWGCIDLDLNQKSQTYTVNRKYYAFAQFSRYIQPGAKFIAIDDPNSVCVVRGSKVVIVTVSDSDRNMTCDLSRFRSLCHDVSVTQTSPEGNLKRLTKIPIIDKTFSANVPAKSVTTFEISGCTY